MITLGDKVTFVSTKHNTKNLSNQQKGKSGYVIQIGQGALDKILVDFEEYPNTQNPTSFNEWWINPKNLIITQFSTEPLK